LEAAHASETLVHIYKTAWRHTAEDNDVQISDIFVSYNQAEPITVAALSKARNVFARSNAGIVGSNPTRGMDVCLR
jgi:hypothetical protein